MTTRSEGGSPTQPMPVRRFLLSFIDCDGMRYAAIMTDQEAFNVLANPVPALVLLTMIEVDVYEIGDC